MAQDDLEADYVVKLKLKPQKEVNYLATEDIDIKNLVSIWGLFLETILIVAEILEIDADDLLERVLTKPEAEQLISRFIESGLKEAG